jgi:uncharacterized protein (DUF2249 family)
MHINEKSKISDIINANEDAIDVIASVNKNFKKLRNPFLRKMLATRVNVKDAARIGGVKPGVLLSRLKTIGFMIDLNEMQSYEKSEIHNKSINTIKLEKMKKNKIVTLDVRPILDGGVDPFNAIMDELKKIDEANETLQIINTFEPIPLLNILKKKGYEYETERPEEGIVHTFLTKTGEISENNSSDNTEEDSYDSIASKFEGKMIEIDVRDLEMPMPMVTILENVEQLNEGEALFVHHKKLPQYLLPELKGRDFVFVSKPIDDDNIKLIIYKK